MLPTDLPAFTERVNALLEALDRRPLSERAMYVWFEALAEFPTRDVFAELDEAPRRLTRATPNELWKALNDRRTARLEAEAKANAERARRERQGVTSATPIGRLALEQLRRAVAPGKQASTAWATEVMDRAAAGHDVPAAEIEMARRALRWDPADVKALLRPRRLMEAQAA